MSTASHVRTWAALATGCLALASRGAEPVDARGGWTEAQLERAPTMRISEWRGGRWLVTPEGHPFIAVAMAHGNAPGPARRVPTDATGKKFGDDLRAYAADRDAWLRDAGFNAFSYTTPESSGVSFPWVATLGGLLPAFINQGPVMTDLFDPEWRRAAANRIAQEAPKFARDSRVIGISLGFPLLVSPHMMPAWGWTRQGKPPTNFLHALKSLDADAPGKIAYVRYLQERYDDVAVYGRARGIAVQSWAELAERDLAAGSDALALHPDDIPFYEEMWSQAVGFLAAELRRVAPGVLVFAPRIIGLRRWPDPWVEAWVKGVGRHVDAFIPELYSDNAYREVVDRIGELAGRPSFIGDGMRVQEFNYAGEATDEDEARAYEAMFTSLLASPWFLGATVCEYRQQRPGFPWYARRPEEGRLGVRHADYSERPALREAYRRLHSRKYALRLELLAARGPLAETKP